MRAIGIGVVTGLLLAGAGCKPAGRTETPPAATPASPEAADVSLAPGESEVAVTDGKVTVVSQEAPRGLLLEKLARAAGFQIVGDPDARPLTLALRDQPIEIVVPALMRDLPYRAQWRVTGGSAEHVLTRLELGEPEAAPAAAPAQAPGSAPERKKARADAIREKLRAMREGRVTEEQRAELDARREEKARSQADLLEQLRSSTPDMRIEAVNGIEPEGPALTTLNGLLADDPDSRVRVAVAEQLGNADGYAAVSALVSALDDSDPTVVLQALDSLQFIGDDTLAPILKAKCGGHAEPKVREACAEAAEFVE
jgi:hypothetical protein